MIELVNELAPAVLATQEGLGHQLAELMEGLDERYALISQRRHDGRTEEHSAIIHDTTVVEPLEVEHRWLSDTPQVPGSVSWDHDLPRLASLVRYRRLADGREFVLLATHFDHRSELARVRSAHQLVDRVAALEPGLPVLVMGDFNADEESEPYAILTAGLRDSWLVADRPGPRLGTFNNYGDPDPGGRRIDWILVNDAVHVDAARTVEATAGGRHPSDHLPIEAVVSF